MEYEVVIVVRDDVLLHRSLGRFANREDAIRESERQQRLRPYAAAYVFWHVTPFTRLLIHHTLT